MTFPFPRVGATLGAQPDQDLVRVMNRTGATFEVGSVVMFDLHSVAAESTTFTVGATTSVLVNVIEPVALGLKHGWFGIVTIAAANDAVLTVCVRGMVQALIVNSPALIDVLSAEASELTLDADLPVAGEKIIAIPMETGGAGPTLLWVLFNGIEGFGSGIDN